MSKNIQLLSVIPDRDCTLESDLREIGKLRYGTINCNHLTGAVVAAEEYDSIMSLLAERGWKKAGYEKGGPEGISTSFLDNPTVPRTPPWRSPEMIAYLASRKD